MVATIYEPALSREEAAPVIDQVLRRLYSSASSQRWALKRATLDDLKVMFRPTRVGLYFGVFQFGKRVLMGLIDPAGRASRTSYSSAIDPYFWKRGRWEESFGVPIDAYDPHWHDRLPPILRKTMRKAASSAIGCEAARRVLDMMISYADGTYEDVLEHTVDDENAGELACWVIAATRGPNMAAMVPLMMWVNGAAPSDVLRAYAEAHQKRGVRRHHLYDILGASERVTKFTAFAMHATKLENWVTTLRSMPSDEAMTLVETLAERCSPLVQQVFPEGINTFLLRFVSNHDLDCRRTLARRRGGLFS